MHLGIPSMKKPFKNHSMWHRLKKLHEISNFVASSPVLGQKRVHCHMFFYVLILQLYFCKVLLISSLFHVQLSETFNVSNIHFKNFFMKNSIYLNQNTLNRFLVVHFETMMFAFFLICTLRDI